MQKSQQIFPNTSEEQADFTGSLHINPKNVIPLWPQECLQIYKDIFLYLPGRREQALDSGDKYKNNKCTHQVWFEYFIPHLRILELKKHNKTHTQK